MHSLTARCYTVQCALCKLTHHVYLDQTFPFYAFLALKKAYCLLNTSSKYFVWWDELEKRYKLQAVCNTKTPPRTGCYSYFLIEKSPKMIYV